MFALVARLLEDGYFVGKFIYLYVKAPQEVTNVGFKQEPTKMTVRQRASWAWMNMSNPGQ